MTCKDPADLPPGTVIGCWRVVSRRGMGSYGVVYQVQRVERPEAGFFALKLARHPLNPRFERERELLSRLRHENVPRLHDSGWWTLSEGIAFPYVVMDWVEGEPLYRWAERRELTARQVLRLLAQLARALEALHEASGVHRDVKGENALVTEEGRAVLTDFGSGHYRGAFELTWQPVPPGTPQYWSPELVSHQWGFRLQATEHYEAGPADDVYALGVTAYRLVTGRYPPPAVGPELAEDGKHWRCVVRLPSDALQGVSPELAALIRRMLSNEPSNRGSAGELARELEHVAETADSRADQPIIWRPVQVPPGRRVRTVPERRALAWRLGAVASVTGLAFLAFSSRESIKSLPERWPAPVAQETREEERGDGGTAGMAEAVLAARVSEAPPVRGPQGLGLDMPKKPLPGQRQRPCGKYEVEIKGGCWVHPPDATPPCGAGLYEWKNGCYAPTFDTSRPPTSEPQ